jgi:hypothetical protein
MDGTFHHECECVFDARARLEERAHIATLPVKVARAQTLFAHVQPIREGHDVCEARSLAHAVT